MAQHRWSIPFVGGYTYIQDDNEFNQLKENTVKRLTETKEHVVLKYNKLHEMCADKKFKDQLYMALGITVASAIVVYGLITVYKWWVGYKFFVLAGGALKTKLWLKLTGIVVVGGVMVYQGYRVYDSIDITDEMDKAIAG